MAPEVTDPTEPVGLVPPPVTPGPVSSGARVTPMPASAAGGSAVAEEFGRKTGPRRFLPADTRAGLLKRIAVGMLFVLFLVNFAETGIEDWLRKKLQDGIYYETELAKAAHWFERGLSFEAQDGTYAIGYWGYLDRLFHPVSSPGAADGSYALPPPRPAAGLAAGDRHRGGLSADFALYILPLPVPERWTYPASGAILLSDLVTSKLIQAFRPFSGLEQLFSPAFTYR